MWVEKSISEQQGFRSPGTKKRCSLTGGKSRGPIRLGVSVPEEWSGPRGVKWWPRRMAAWLREIPAIKSEFL